MLEDVPRDYDTEPVRYCSKCYSLKIRYDEASDIEYCADCGCSDMLESSIEDWERLYEQRFGHKYVVRSDNPKNSYIFKLPLSKLKSMLFESPIWRTFVKSLYPRFPMGLGKADSIILLFDKLVKDNRLDDLRLLLLKHIKTKNYGREEDKTNGEK